jgi:hypothetical protein
MICAICLQRNHATKAPLIDMKMSLTSVAHQPAGCDMIAVAQTAGILLRAGLHCAQNAPAGRLLSRMPGP